MKRFLMSLLLAGSALAAPVTVTTETGPLTLKAPATRVVPLEYSFLDTLIALGVKPVAAAIGTQGGDRGAPAYLLPHLVGVREVGSRGQPSLEGLAASRPDLILADPLIHKTLVGPLGRLAPTAVLTSRRASYDDVMNQVLLIGRLVGREAVARNIMADQARLVQKARAFAAKKAPSMVLAVATPQSLTVHTTESFAGSLLEALGRRDAVKPQGGQTQFETSLEGLAALAPQTLVLFTGADEVPITRAWAQNPLWQRLPAVQRGRVYVFDRDLWTRARGPMALKLMVAQAIASGLLADRAPARGYTLQ